MKNLYKIHNENANPQFRLHLWHFLLAVRIPSMGRVSTGPSKPQKALESLTFESGVRKPYKALVLEMEPYKMKKAFSSSDKKIFVVRQIYFCQVTSFFCGGTTFIFVEQHFFSSDKIFFCHQSLINASIMTLQSLRKPYFSNV